MTTRPTEHPSHEWIELVTHQAGGPPRDLFVQTRRLRGGLESDAVVSISARFRDVQGRIRLTRFIMKQLDGAAWREARIYSQLARSPAGRLAPSLLGVRTGRRGGARLYLEAVVPVARWPWRDPRHAARVLEAVADLHHGDSAVALAPHVRDWDYDADLRRNALALIEQAQQLRRVPELRAVRESLPALRRLAGALPRVRAEIAAFDVLRATVLHGDLHPGNVMIRRRHGREEPVLLDWARARTGSPLEDVSSWLQSLGYWEPEVKRRHDSVLGAYLAARGHSPTPGRALRDAYWLAGASNCFSGALQYHLAMAADERLPRGTRVRAAGAAADCLRVVRRADACWRA